MAGGQADRTANHEGGEAMRLATEAELATWDELIAANPDGGNSLQTFAWGEFKGNYGWKPIRVIYKLKSREIAVQILERQVPLLGKIWYCPKGPGVDSLDDFIEIVTQTKLAKPGVLFMRWEPELLDDLVDKQFLTSAGLVKATKDPGSKSTIFIDLTRDEDEVLASFSQSTRRNLRKAADAGVTVEHVEATKANLETMYELMKATEARAGYGLRPKQYFLDYWKAQSKAGQGEIFLTKHEGDVLAGIFVTHIGARAWYKDGGSLDLKRELQPTYMMQWQVMRWCLKHGITSYDMVGTPNRDQLGTGHSKQGLYEFKSKFNPEITEFIGAWDQPLSGLYPLWGVIGERLAGRAAMKRPEKFLY